MIHPAVRSLRHQIDRIEFRQNISNDALELKDLFSELEIADFGNEIGCLESRFNYWVKVVSSIRGRTEASLITRDAIVTHLRALTTELVMILTGSSSRRTPDPEIDHLLWSTLSDKDTVFLDQFLASAQMSAEYSGCYVLGSFDRRKTFDVQQLRAATLALALSAQDNTQKYTVGVIGAGASGVTFGTTMAMLGHEVKVFETGPHACYLQEQASHRLVHPKIYDWPLTDATDLDFHLAGYSWSADSAREVSSRLRRQFEVSKLQVAGQLTAEFDTTAERIECSTDLDGVSRYRLFSKRHQLGTFDKLIFCVGFGLEPDVRFGVENQGYWEPPIPTQARRDHAEAKLSILVSGSGDGALIDAIHFAMKRFSHQKILTMFESPYFLEFCAKLHEVEEQIIDTYSSSERRTTNAYQVYEQIYSALGSDLMKFDSEIFDENTNVVIHSVTEGFFSPNSSILNRAVLFLLMKARVVDFRIGPLSGKQIARQKRSSGKIAWKVKWQEGVAEDFDHVILRHGVDQMHFFRKFPQLSGKFSAMHERSAEMDLIRGLPDSLLNFINRIDLLALENFE